MQPHRILTVFGSHFTFALIAVATSDESIVQTLGLDPIVSNTPVIGVVGDSLSDEYATYPYGFYERNWTMLLEHTGYGELGDFQSFRMYPRLYGYEYNWARAGATTSDVIDEGQVLGLSLQILEHKIEVAVMLIGANDFGAVYNDIYDGTMTQVEIDKFMRDLKDNLKNIIEPLADTSPPIFIVCTIPDLGDTPNHRLGSHPDAEKREKVSILIREANLYITELAEANGAEVIDTYAWFKAMVVSEEYRYMGYRLQTGTGGYEPYHMFCIDTFHPGTLVQCYLANQILSTIEAERVRLINEQIETYNLEKQKDPTIADFVAVDPIKARNREIPNNVIFPILEVAPSADIFFPDTIFTDPSHNVAMNSWFGVFAVDNYPWINHQEHGWLYCDGYGGSVWIRIWDSHLGWLHTKPEAYPVVIQVSNGHALRYELGSREPRRFYDLVTNSWIEVPYGAPILAEE